MIRINLLPQDARKSRRGGGGGFTLDKTKVVPLVVLALVLTACTSTLMIQGARVSSAEREVAAARAETEQYKKTIALIDDMVRKEQELNRRLALVDTLDKDRFKTVRVMDEVARRVPRYMWLTSLKNVTPDRVAIDGYAFSNLVVSDLMSSLEKSEMFREVELSGVRRKVVDGQNAVNFTVTSGVDVARLERESES
ncbi:MAG: PilN domain-containing protein [bacterium]|nr:PilN domain-containing protein [Gemmatimonadota bacterium]